MPGRPPEPMRERKASLGSADPPEGHEETPLSASPRGTGPVTQPSPPPTWGGIGWGVDDKFPAWEQIESGRYMPRRTRGSFPGRELG